MQHTQQTPPAPTLPFSSTMLVVATVVVALGALILKQPTLVWLSPVVVGVVGWFALNNKWSPLVFLALAGVAFALAWWQLGFVVAFAGALVLVLAWGLTTLATNFG